MGRTVPTPPIVVVYGDETHQKETALTRTLDTLLPPAVDRALALTAYDGDRSADDGGPSIQSVLEDLTTLPFLTDLRVVLIRAADAFISAHRERLEKYLAAPARTGVLVLECRAFPKTTKLYKAAAAVGGDVIECKRLFGKALIDLVAAEAGRHKKRLEYATAARLVDLVGSEAGTLVAEVEKLALYVGQRQEITDRDVGDLVGQTREEKVFAVADAAGAGRLAEALRLWHQVIETDPEASFRALGGMAFVVRRWLSAQRALAEGASVREIAPKLMMWGRERELEAILRRQPASRLRRALAALADLDSQAKSGGRSIERGIELLLVRLGAPAA
jgi:DNA polymerase-3 subunit delta